ncbi:ATP synthase alpha/beta family, beta-barrel domain protein, partial [Chlamydia psittaci 84-8471/1]
PYLV